MVTTKRLQRLALAAGFAAVGGLCLFPPWQYHVTTAFRLRVSPELELSYRTEWSEWQPGDSQLETGFAPLWQPQHEFREHVDTNEAWIIHTRSTFSNLHLDWTRLLLLCVVAVLFTFFLVILLGMRGG